MGLFWVRCVRLADGPFGPGPEERLCLTEEAGLWLDWVDKLGGGWVSIVGV